MSSLRIEIGAAKRLGEIERLLGRWEGAANEATPSPKVQQANVVRAAVDTVALAGNNCSFEQAMAVLRGKPMLTPAAEVLELENAMAAYQRLPTWNPFEQGDLLEAHAQLTEGLLSDAGRFRSGPVRAKERRAPRNALPAGRVREAMRSLFRFVRQESNVPPILGAILFHAELARVQPFSDGNGRIARLWQNALLRKASPFFAHAPIESLLKEHQQQHEAALAGACSATTLGAAQLTEHAGPFIEHTLEILLLALQRLEGQLRGRSETAEDRAAKARQTLGKSWFPRKAYRALFPRLSTASASRDLANAVADGRLKSRGARALTEYRFR
jgi:Fic family protein